MRRPIQQQLLWPMLAVVVLASAVTALLAAWLGMANARRAEEIRLHQLASALTDAGFPLTESVLKRMADLSGAQFVTLDQGGEIQQSSLALDQVDQRQLARLPANPTSDKSSTHDPLKLSTGQFRGVRIPIRTSSTVRPLSLVILTSQSRWNDLAWQAALPPLVAGMLAAGFAGLFAVLLSRHFVRRIHALGDRAARLAQGRFERGPLPETDDELRDLAIALNTAAEQLDRYETQVRRGERLQTLGRLGAGMAHQLRNAITGARMAMDLHMSELPPGIDRESLDVAVHQLALMEAYLQRFLTLGRGESPATVDVNLVDLVSGCMELVGPMCRHHGIAVDWQPPAGPITINADAEALRQMILNLLINAIEAVQPLPPTERKLSVDLRCEAEFVRLQIWDPGPGPSADVAAKLFEPFVTDKPDGTGLGLAVAQEIAQQHRGTIHWFREAGKTCFEATLAVPVDDDGCRSG